MSSHWNFSDEPNTACFTTRDVLEGDSILRVYHDFDGDWQFHGQADATEVEPQVVCLREILSRDSSLLTLRDLPEGWCAQRDATDQAWNRSKNHPCPTYEENGFYLEDADWLAQFLTDISPPSLEQREQLALGGFVKLVFRFRAEQSERQDYDCERMWVQITGADDQGFYEGTLENEPHHPQAKLGDPVAFHPLHIIEIATEDG